MKKKQNKTILSITIRYLSVLILGLGNFYILREILTPLTIHTTNTILSIFTSTLLIKDTIHTTFLAIQISPSCVATSAFYLLIALILLTPSIKPRTRANAIITAVATLFILNITRILILVPLATTSYFDMTHWIFWHLISTIFVVAIWFTITKLYKIKSIPIYSDFKYLKSLF